jgi:hypothetical protein
MAFWRISLLSIFLIMLPYPFAASADDGMPSNNHLAGNPLIGTWRNDDARWDRGPAAVTFVTFGPDGRYLVRLYHSRLPGSANGASVIAGAYEITGPGRFVFRTREVFNCPNGSNCVPYQTTSSGGDEQQAMSFRFEGPDRLIDGEGLAWRRMRQP